MISTTIKLATELRCGCGRCCHMDRFLTSDQILASELAIVQTTKEALEAVVLQEAKSRHWRTLGPSGEWFCEVCGPVAERVLNPLRAVSR